MWGSPKPLRYLGLDAEVCVELLLLELLLLELLLVELLLELLLLELLLELPLE